MNRLLALLSAFGIGVSGGLLAAPPVGADDLRPVYSKLRESLVMVQATYTGHASVPGELTNDGRPITGSDRSFTASCSGFVVDPSGYIATAGHCVETSGEDATTFRTALIDELVEREVIQPEQRLDWLAQAEQDRWPVEGPNGSDVDVRVEVIQPPGKNRVIDRLMAADLVAFQPFRDGDNALLRVVNIAPLEPVVIAENQPQAGQAVTAIGWPGLITRVMDPTRIPEPSFKTGTVSSVQVEDTGEPKTEINADLSGGMSGGPTIDNATGEVMGVNSFGLVDSSAEGLNFITDVTTLRTFLTTHGVKLTPSEKPAASAPASNGGFPWWILILLGLLAAGGAALAAMARKRKSVAVGGYSTQIDSARGQVYTPPAAPPSIPPGPPPAAAQTPVIEGDVIDPPPAPWPPGNP